VLISISGTFFGELGSLNDLNILDKSEILGNIFTGALNLLINKYKIDGEKIDFMYFLTDRIYPDYSIFVKTLRVPCNEKEHFYCARQELEQKNVECAFGNLVAKWRILKQKFWLWYLNEIDDIVKSCVIMHNMIVEDHHGDILAMDDHVEFDEIFQGAVANPNTTYVGVVHNNLNAVNAPTNLANPTNDKLSFLRFVESECTEIARANIAAMLSHCVEKSRSYVEDTSKSMQLRQALINHLWSMRQKAK